MFSYPIRLLLCLCLLFSWYTLPAQIPPIGQWREHLNYQTAIQVVYGNKLYCATSQALFAIDANNQSQRFSKANGLNDIGVSTIGWDEQGQQLIIAYQNSNLDIIKDNNTRNIGDIKRSSFPGDKRIQHIYCENGTAYLSSGIGIILANLNRYEISDTWTIGQQGNATRVNAFIQNNNYRYAATDEGLKIALPTSNPANYQNWNLVSNLPAGPVTHIAKGDNDRMVVRTTNGLYIGSGTQWQALYNDPSWPILNIESAPNRGVLICERRSNGEARVILLSYNGTISRILSQPGVISLPRSATMNNEQIWVADQFGGLSRFGNTIDRFIPNGPNGNAPTGQMISKAGVIRAAAGSINEAWNYQFNRDGIYQFQNDQWLSFNNQTITAFNSIFDFITLANDPRNNSFWAGSFGGGLIRLSDNSTPQVFRSQNSSLQEAIGDPGNIRVSGLAFDSRNNLWISNYGAAKPLSLRSASDSTWHSFSLPFTLLENGIAQIVIDDQDQLWILGPKGNGLICYAPGNNPTNTNDDAWRRYLSGNGNGNLPSNNIYSLAKDKDGSIWVGTDKGIGIIRCTDRVFAGGGCEAIQPVVQQDRLAGLLFADEQVQCLAVDGANRKWVGSKNGLWLISANGERIIYRFTAENSPLLGNDVRQLSIDPQTGEVFISTTNGICSFRSTATEGGQSNQDVKVFPNPVPPGYQGTIAIRGLVDHALVKITELNGKLVHQTRALGGQAIWNGRQYNGTQVAPGVYLVVIRDDNGKEYIATKIVIAGK
jgi:ligand-binding sensor domain-containing protein